ncbi:MAG: 1-acyl-sn-glycerol-3-phosphate acyltransferase [Clostridia bacterium]|nr:1-acyl-sn-glycerol-3-phosphate acyltransferase [Clostridia bacterium]
MSSAKKKQKKIGRINPVLYWFVYHILYPLYRHRYGLTIDRSGIADLKEPALVVASHTSNKDHWLVGMALYPLRPNFVISEHFMAKPMLRPILHLAHIITKKMFCPDVSTIMNVLRAKREGNTVVLFPEGRLACNGRTGRVTEGTAALVKKLGVPVYAVTANGASATFPKWAKDPRHGKIHITTEKLLSPEEVATLSLAEIEAKIQKAITHDDMAIMSGVRYKCKKTAEGLDGILYRCPTCNREFSMKTQGRRIFCTECSFSAELDETYRFHGAPFDRILEWYDWQVAQIDLEKDELSCEAVIGAVDKKGNMDTQAGRARIRMNRDSFTLEGTVFGCPVSFTRDTVGIVGFPITVGAEFDIYHNNTLYYMYPQPDSRTSVKWVSFLDRVVEESRKTTLDN